MNGTGKKAFGQPKMNEFCRNLINNLTCIRMRMFIGLLFSFFNVVMSQEVQKASQCFKSRGIPKVSFGCDAGNMIKIDRAFHGISNPDKTQSNGPDVCLPNSGQDSVNCSYCEGDCIDDSMNLVYDWSTCMGNTSCTRTVMQSYMPACSGPEKFSDYLQVEYECVDKTEVIDICSASQQWLFEGHLTSPNYPEHYPTSVDCLCTLQTDWNSRITLSFYDLLLETKQGRCRADWLMLRQKAQKHRHCGAIMTGTKNITSETNSITLQFHTDENDNTTQNFQYFSRKLKGFWLHFIAEPAASVQVMCRRLTADDPEVQEIQADDADYTEVLPTSPDNVTSGGGNEGGESGGAGVGQGGGGDGGVVTKSTPGGSGQNTIDTTNNQNSGGNQVDAQGGDDTNSATTTNMKAVSELLIHLTYLVLALHLVH